MYMNEIRSQVRWIYVKDVPNVQLRHIHLENNENKSVTNSRDAQEVPHARGLQVKRTCSITRCESKSVVVVGVANYALLPAFDFHL